MFRVPQLPLALELIDFREQAAEFLVFLCQVLLRCFLHTRKHTSQKQVYNVRHRTENKKRALPH
jgi:hypothetical protein